MSAERINLGPDTGDTDTSQPEAPRPDFRMPLPLEADIQHESERKARRNRKRRKKVLNNAIVQTIQATSQPPKPARESGTLAMDTGELTLWQRPEDSPQTRASATLGKKVVGISEQSKPEQVADPTSDQAPDRAEVDARFKDSDNIDVQTDHHQDPQSNTEDQNHETSQAETAENTAKADEQPVVRPPFQHEPPAEVLPATPANQGPNPFEQSYEPPQPPAQPPDLMSYRRRFWNEQPALIVTEHTAPHLPELHDYQHQAYEASQSEPTYSASRTQYAEAPASVPLAGNRYESPTPPGYQRTPADVNRAAWTGLFVGWWFGRRGKRKAIEQARKAGVKQGIASAKAGQQVAMPRRTAESYVAPANPRLEAEPLYPYRAPEAGRTVVQPLSVEAHVARRQQAEPLRQLQVAGEAGFVLDRLVSPIAAIAVFDRAVNRPALERVELPSGVRAAAAKVAELLVTKTPDGSSPAARIGNGIERQLGSRELLRLSKDIKIEGISLKEIYKAKRIDEDGLRSIVSTYLAGGDVRKQLAHEVSVKEQSYERDPVLRHQQQDDSGEPKPETGSGRRPRTVLATSDIESGAARASVGQTLGHAFGVVAASTESTARSAGRAIASSAKTAQRDLIDNSNTTDWLSITAVVVLYSIILMLLF